MAAPLRPEPAHINGTVVNRARALARRPRPSPRGGQARRESLQEAIVLEPFQSLLRRPRARWQDRIRMQALLAELAGGLSLATDMGAGQPLQSALASTILSTRLAARIGLTQEEQRLAYYSSVLRFIGCSSTAPEASQIGLGHDTSLHYSLSICDMADPEQIETSLGKYMAPDASDEVRQKAVAGFMEAMTFPALAGERHCAQALVLSRRLPVPEGVEAILAHMYSRFDGIGSPTGQPEEIPIVARICAITAAVAMATRSLGKAEALDIARGRRAGQYCPDCVDVLLGDHATLMDGLDAPSCWDVYCDLEPGGSITLTGTVLDAACSAYGDYADQKSGYMLGHSRRVGASAFGAATAASLPAEVCEDLRLAGFLHDVGRAGVPTGIWDKTEELTPHERQLLEGHSAHTEALLRLAPGLAPLCDLATAAHERADGSGYPRSSRGAGLPGGILAAADVFEALTHDRPWRPAYSHEAATDLLLQESREGRLHKKAVSAVLEFQGVGKVTTERAYPDGLSRREVEVLGLLARGLPTKQIAERLNIAPKTAENHIGKIYDKTKARGRAAAALYAVEHGLGE